MFLFTIIYNRFLCYPSKLKSKKNISMTAASTEQTKHRSTESNMLLADQQASTSQKLQLASTTNIKIETDIDEIIPTGKYLRHAFNYYDFFLTHFHKKTVRIF